MQAIINIMDQEMHPHAATERQTERERASEGDTHSFLVTLLNFYENIVHVELLIK